MRIALIIETMDPRRGGREKSTAQIAEGLARRGHEVSILCEGGRWECEDVTMHQFGRRGLLRVQRLGYFVASVQAVIADGGFDVVHAMLPIPGATIYQPRGGTIPGQIGGSFRRWKLMGPIRTGVFEPLNFRRRKLGELERRIVADQNVLCLAVSHMVVQEFHEFYGREAGVRMVYNGVEVPEIDPEQWAQWRQQRRFEMGVGQDDPVFISVATNFALKGIDEAIRAFAKWNDRNYGRLNARLVIVGRDMVEGHERVAGLRGVGRQVVFVPPTTEIHQWYADADACVLLSWYDPCSRTVLEATSLGIPSVTTVYNGAAEILADGAGIVVSSPTDVRAVTAAFDELADPQRRAQRAEACLRAAPQVTMDRHVEGLLEAYTEARKRQ